MRKNLAVLASLVALALATSGCASKNFVRNRVAPLVEHTNQLDEKTAANSAQIRSTDERAQQGITQAQAAADAAQKAAQNSTAQAQAAQSAAGQAVQRADKLEAAVRNLDQYKPLSTVTVTFGFDRANLDKAAIAQLDSLGASLAAQKNYLLELIGGADSVGTAQYNYQLSQRRADAVVQYLATRYSVEPRRIARIGLGKDREVASNRTAEGRQQNRSVELRLLVNANAQ